MEHKWSLTRVEHFNVSPTTYRLRFIWDCHIDHECVVDKRIIGTSTFCVSAPYKTVDTHHNELKAHLVED